MHLLLYFIVILYYSVWLYSFGSSSSPSFSHTFYIYIYIYICWDRDIRFWCVQSWLSENIICGEIELIFIWESYTCLNFEKLTGSMQCKCRNTLSSLIKFILCKWWCIRLNLATRQAYLSMLCKKDWSAHTGDWTHFFIFFVLYISSVPI